MKYLIAILVLLPFTAAAHPPSKCIEPTRQFVGFSTVEVEGNVGLISRNETCSNEFVGARHCTSQEYIESPNVPTGLLSAGWVWPSLSVATSSSLVDYSGMVASASDFHCVRSGSGLAFVNGRPVIVVCLGPRPVACCALQP